MPANHQSNSALAELQTKLQSEFNQHFNRPASIVVAAPGRVNLIGEHIDYNDGFVLPLALERNVVIAADPVVDDSSSSTIRLYSTKFSQSETIDLNQEIKPGQAGRKGWVGYVEGVLAGFVELGVSLPAFDAVIDSTVPLGGGLSSSAALEVATATLMEALTGHVLDPKDKALLCQKAEHQFAGVPCGIMDQFSSVFGQPNELMLIDCRAQSVESVPFTARDIEVLICNSNVKHALTGGEYAQRRQECDWALGKLKQNSWRDVTPECLQKSRQKLTDVEFRRAGHVVTEIARTLEAAAACRSCDWSSLGQLMYASHDSLRDDFEVSCKELDVLVELAREIGPAGGVIGSRMTGGGFGGCTVSLVKSKRLQSVMGLLSERYESATGIKPHCFSTRPGQGAQVLTVA